MQKVILEFSVVFLATFLCWETRGTLFTHANIDTKTLRAAATAFGQNMDVFLRQRRQQTYFFWGGAKRQEIDVFFVRPKHPARRQDSLCLGGGEGKRSLATPDLSCLFWQEGEGGGSSSGRGCDGSPPAPAASGTPCGGVRSSSPPCLLLLPSANSSMRWVLMCCFMLYRWIKRLKNGTTLVKFHKKKWQNLSNYKWKKVRKYR